SRAGTAAIEALENCDGPAVEAALRAALSSPHVLVRMAAIDDLCRRNAPDVAGFVRILTNDTSWITRRRALEALASLPGPEHWHMRGGAAARPGRAGKALVKTLVAGGGPPDLLAALDAGSHTRRVEGVRLYLRWRWHGVRPPEPIWELDDPRRFCPFWDWDA